MNKWMFWGENPLFLEKSIFSIYFFPLAACSTIFSCSFLAFYIFVVALGFRLRLLSTRGLVSKCPSDFPAMTFQMLTCSPCQKGHKLAVFARYCTYIPCKCSSYLVIRKSPGFGCRSYTRPPSDKSLKRTKS